jgi:hypothetical protein
MSNINFYDTEKVKKKNPTRKDEQLEYSGIKLRTRNLLCGASGSGKTNALMNYIFLSSKPRKGTFRHVFLCYKTDEPLYEVLQEQLKDKITVFKDLASVPTVESFPDQPDHEILFVFDDIVNEKDKKNLKKLENYYAFSRKKGITTFFLTQSYYQTHKFLRDNTDNILLLSIKSNNDLKRIISEFATKDISGEQIVAMFEYATSEPLNFLKITPSYNTPINKKFSKNWLQFLDPKDFGNNIQQQVNYDSDNEKSEDDEPVITTRKKKAISCK